MAGIWDGIGALVSKVMTYVPGRVEKLKNERQRLLDERKKIMESKASGRGINRVCAIDSRLQEISTILGNAAKD